MSSASTRLERLLALVPYLLAHPGVAVARAARDFGVTQAVLLDDLQLLFVCGLPGHQPDDLIEVSVDAGQINISNADTIARPLRLRPDEALALLMGLKVLTSVPVNPGWANQAEQAPADSSSVVNSLMGKLSVAAGLNEPGADPLQALTVAPDDQAGKVELVQRAMQEQRQLCIEYHSPRRDSLTLRHVDPLSVEAVEGHYYLQAWCHESDELRVFRTDRMVRVSLTDLPRYVPRDAHPKRLPRSVFISSGDDVEVSLLVSPQAQWMVDYYSAQVQQHLEQGWLRITLRTPDTAWLVSLVLRLGEQVSVVGPDFLVEQVQAQALSALEVATA